MGEARERTSGDSAESFVTGAPTQPGSVSVCIIAQNEASRLPRALESVKWATEIIVVDGGSVDGTADVARRFGARVVFNPWPGFARQRNFAIDAAVGEWVLELDADEAVTPTLSDEVEQFLSSDLSACYDIAALPLRQYFLGRPLGPSGRYPMYRPRLFRRGLYRHDESRAVHEALRPRGPVYPLRGEIAHTLAGSVTEAATDLWRYSRLEARHVRSTPTARAAAVGILLRPSLKFAWRAVIAGGWRDGWRGMVKIAVDCTYDAFVWVWAIWLRLPPQGQGHSTGHFHARGSESKRVGLLVTRGTVLPIAWVRENLQADEVTIFLLRGANSVMETVAPPDRVAPVQPPTWMALLRALDVETMLRPFSILVDTGGLPKIVRAVGSRLVAASVVTVPQAE